MGRWSELMIESRSPRYCFSSEEYKEATRDSYSSKYNDIIEEKLIPECKKFIEFVDGVCSNHQSHRFLITCNYCQKDFKTIHNREVRCSSCCCLIEQKLKTYAFEKLKKLANVYNIKRRRRDFIIDDLVQNVENYFT